MPVLIDPQLHSVVRNSDLSQDELNSILNQLRTLGRPSTPRPPPPQNLQLNGYAPPPIQSVLPTVQSALPQSNPPVAPISADLRAFLNTISAPQQSQQHVVTAPQITPNLSSVLSSMMKNGVKPLPSGALDSLKQINLLQTSQTTSNALQKYENAILNIRLKATSAEILKYVTLLFCTCDSNFKEFRQSPQLVSFLYDRQASQCKQCGLRIPQEEGGQQKMDDHLDMHFMQNSRIDQNAGRGHSRSWFVGFEVCQLVL